MSQAGIINESTAAGSDVKTLTGDFGGVVGADVANNIDILGTAAQGLSFTGTPASSLIRGTIADATEAQKGVLELATDAESIAGADTSRGIVPSSLAAKLGVQTANAMPYGTGTAAAVGWSAALTDGQLMIGGTGIAPAAANLVSGDGTVTITNGANSIDLSAGGALPDTFVTDAGSATPAANILNIVGTSGQGITSSGAGNTVTFTVQDTATSQKGVIELATDAESIAGTDTVRGIVPSSLGAKLGAQTANAVPYGAGTAAAVGWTAALTNGQLVIGSTGVAPATATLTEGTGIDVTNGAGTITVASSGGGLDWTVVTGATQAAAINNGYICNRAAGVTVTLPDTAAVGSILRIVGMDGNWVLAQNAGETVYFGLQATTTGAGGSLTATDNRDCVELVCSVANTDWVVMSSVGNITVT